MKTEPITRQTLETLSVFLTHGWEPGFLATLVEDPRIRQLALTTCRRTIDEHRARFTEYMAAYGPTAEIEYLLKLEEDITFNLLAPNFAISVGLGGTMKSNMMLELARTNDKDLYLRFERQISCFVFRQNRLGRIMEACGWMFSRRVRLDIYDDTCFDLQQDFVDLKARNLSTFTRRWACLQLLLKGIYFWFDTVFRAMPRPLQWASLVFAAGLLGALMGQLGLNLGLLR